MKYNIYLFSFSTILILFSFSFINVSAEDEHLDMSYLSSALSIGNLIQRLNITIDELPKLSTKAIEKAKNYLYKIFSLAKEYPKEEEDPNTCSTEDQFIHAKIVALENMERDPNAKSYGEEFVYMYLSHYVDIPAEYLGSCSKNDEEPYLANWITNDDRKAYDIFLTNIHKIEIIEKFRNILSKISDGISKFDEREKLFHRKGIAKSVSNKIEKQFKDGTFKNTISKTGKVIILESIDFIKEKLENTELPEEDIIKEVKESIGKEVLSKDLAESIFDSVNVLFEMAIGSTNIFTAALTMINLPLQIFTALAPKAALVSMLYSLSLRVAGNTDRYLETEYDDW